MSQGRHKNNIGILRMNDDPANGVGVFQAHNGPVLAGINGLINSVAGDDIAANAGFAGGRVNHVRIRGRHSNTADGGGHVLDLIGHGTPGKSIIGTFPDTSAYATEIVCMRIAGDSTDRKHAASPKWPNGAPAQSMPWTFLVVLLVVARWGGIRGRFRSARVFLFRR